MHPVTESIFGTPSVNQLVALRAQRALIRLLRDDVQESWRRLTTTDLEGSWRSGAQRAYADRVRYLCRDLRAVVRELDDAESSVNRSIDRMKAGI